MLAAIVGCETTAVGLLAVVGAITIFFFLLDTIYTLLQYARGFLAKYFLPHENHTLVSKYGKWAGKLYMYLPFNKIIILVK